MNNARLRRVSTTLLAASFPILGACWSAAPSRTGVAVSPDAGEDASGDVADDGAAASPDGDSGAATDGAAPGDAASGPVVVSISESSFTFATPDLSHGLTATVTGTATTTL